MASSTIQHEPSRSFETAMRFATVTLRSPEVEWDCDEAIDPAETVTSVDEKLGGARGAMVALTAETVVALCLFGVWEILRLLR